MYIYNSLTRKMGVFSTIIPKKVTIYVCGITPYDTTHLGHAFTYISFDALIRFLKLRGYEVIYSQNITDINDRDGDILERARIQNISWSDLATFWTEKFLRDMQDLNWTAPTHYLKASESIEIMVSLIQRLLERGIAYSHNNSVYLDITKKKGYGKLSRLTEAQMLKMAKNFEEDVNNPNKRNPLDITLWRATEPHQQIHIPSFESPFGKGRPGWHIECSAMSIGSLGKQIDIHGGGKDLVFPHHEAEIIQSEGSTEKIPFAKYWIHTGQVFYEGEKVSKSKGNLVMVSRLLEKYSANAVRFLLLSHHYRENWEYREEELAMAEKRLRGLVGKLRATGKTKFVDIMNQDLDTPKALELMLHTKSKTIYDALGFLDPLE
ncbi:cysteine--tRNA ligase [Candidatus Collierbacteria bacterium RIFOXYB2_FULL_46_14]|uniref:Cysteine--tRNA ligase n=1 Tax=Candidatus Collierbacteria bacterium GW2011_GWA2_46_26 TaxID=1618381 RepID=A0A0G1SHW0_9BACT|nr:MAG: Cysteine-tRNA ligase [Candidatus Collierbacteria bacterium GW2011_GWC2_44_13]KKU32920.1 MAG: Cysteine-tRNA ligase [Candidatus Collierbacteria bacterium GW2011_GWA2_46_26]OGD72897.1 MAG: cysteine--tRNA ligase [Candidatus Collierbacteria bacterium RIFOXYB2_FULL_46_14]OGD75939.1 MAG: cysteine--tRNA ligase [Candidatus Collierbacteria bacterium RIFOXYA2_FULL_46_20]OGD77275.1 MAG: cysteine--tRNA ligase [Candidatus Collierbacteria bacterium RIFOXYC2_FULL_43_15]OGD80565.1 MAG: cysteine--tRNA l